MTHNHKPGERCAMCELGPEKFHALEQKNMEEHGFFSHVIPEGNVINYHTHGLVESRNVMDLQILLGIRAETAHKIIWTIVQMIDEGLKLKDGLEIDLKGWESSTIPNCSCLRIKVVKAVETGREVFRVILPDKTGKLERDMAHPFNHQYDDIPNSQLN